MYVDGKSLFADRCYVPRQTRFIAGRGVLVNQALVDRFVDQRNCRAQRFSAQFCIAVSDRTPKAFDLGTELSAVAAVDRVPLCGLSNSFFCRFMICH